VTSALVLLDARVSECVTSVLVLLDARASECVTSVLVLSDARASECVTSVLVILIVHGLAAAARLRMLLPLLLQLALCVTCAIKFWPCV